MSVEYVIYIWRKEDYDEDVVEVFLHNIINSKYFTNLNNLWSFGETNKRELEITKKYGLQPSIIIETFPFFVYGNSNDLSDYDIETLRNAFESEPVPVDENLVKKFPRNKKLRDFLIPFIGKNVDAFFIAW